MDIFKAIELLIFSVFVLGMMVIGVIGTVDALNLKLKGTLVIISMYGLIIFGMITGKII